MKEEYSNNIRRWYDKDPVLSKSMKILEESDDETQIKIALNLIKVIMEHNLSENTFLAIDDILTSAENGDDGGPRERWYDIDTTLRTAIHMLEASPDVVKKSIAKEMAKIVVEKIKDDPDDAEDEEDNDFNNI